MYETTVRVRVRYAETDQMGYVYYGHYLTYYEVARVESLRQLGLNYKDMEADGVMMPVKNVRNQYHLPAKYDELLAIKVKIKEMPRAKIVFYYEITNEAGETIHEGETLLVFVAMDTGRLCRCPDQLARLLAPHFEK